MEREIGLILHYARSTKRTHVYWTEDETAAVSQLYIKRSALPSDPPATIKLGIVSQIPDLKEII